MAAKLIRTKSRLALAEEATAGTIETLSATHVRVKAYDANLKLVIDPIVRQAQGATGHDAPARGAKHTELSFQSYVHGASSGLPAWSTLLKACGYSLTSTTFTRTDTQANWKTISAAHWQDGRKKSARGLMFNGKFNFSSGNPVSIDWTGQGGWQAAPADEALPASNYESILIPSWQGTGSLLFDGSAAHAVSTVTFDMGNDLSLRQDPNATGGYLQGDIGNPVPTITMDPEATLFATRNWHAIEAANTLVDLVAVVNGGTGNTITFTFNDIVLSKSPEDQDRNNNLVDALGFDVTGAITIAFS